MPSSSLDAVTEAVEATLKQAEALVSALTSTHRLLSAAARDIAEARTSEVPQDIAARLSALERQLASARPSVPLTTDASPPGQQSEVVAVEPVASTMLARPAAAPRTQGTYEVPSLEALPDVAATVAAAAAREEADAPAAVASADEHIDFDSLNALTAVLDDEDIASNQGDEPAPHSSSTSDDAPRAVSFPADSGPTLI